MSEFTKFYSKKYPKLDLNEEWLKFRIYNEDSRRTKLKSERLGFINWLKNAEKYRLQSPEAISERETQAELKKNEERFSLKGKPMPKDLKEKYKKLLVDKTL